MSQKYIKVKVYKRSIHKHCMRKDCNLDAEVTATRKTGGLTMDVRYCMGHAEMGGLVNGPS